MAEPEFMPDFQSFTDEQGRSFYATNVDAASPRGQAVLTQLRAAGYDPVIEPRPEYGEDRFVINLTGDDAGRFERHQFFKGVPLPNRDPLPASPRLPPGVSLQPIPHGNGESPVVMWGNRPVIVANVNGVNVPFYTSTGGGDKWDVPPGRWYPFFGISQDGPMPGWLNKTPDVGQYYGSEVLTDIARHLDGQYGNVIGNPGIPRLPYPTDKTQPIPPGPHFDVINRDMRPLGRTNESMNVLDNINSVLQRVNGNGAPSLVSTTLSFDDDLPPPDAPPLPPGVRMAGIPYEAQGHKGMSDVVGLTTVDETGKTVVRPVVIAEIDGVKVPFYISSGEGGKTDVAAGKWYPFFGVGPDGWINKGPDMAHYYGSEKLRAIAEHLDQTYGDVSSDPDIPQLPVREKGRRIGGPHIDAINADIPMPVGNSAAGHGIFYENIKTIFGRIGDGTALGIATSRAEEWERKASTSSEQDIPSGRKGHDPLADNDLAPAPTPGTAATDEDGGLSIFDTPEDGDEPPVRAPAPETPPEGLSIFDVPEDGDTPATTATTTTPERAGLLLRRATTPATTATTTTPEPAPQPPPAPLDVMEDEGLRTRPPQTETAPKPETGGLSVFDVPEDTPAPVKPQPRPDQPHPPDGGTSHLQDGGNHAPQNNHPHMPPGRAAGLGGAILSVGQFGMDLYNLATGKDEPSNITETGLTGTGLVTNAIGTADEVVEAVKNFKAPGAPAAAATTLNNAAKWAGRAGGAASVVGGAYQVYQTEGNFINEDGGAGRKTIAAGTATAATTISLLPMAATATGASAGAVGTIVTVGGPVVLTGAAVVQTYRAGEAILDTYDVLTAYHQGVDANTAARKIGDSETPTILNYKQLQYAMWGFSNKLDGLHGDITRGTDGHIIGLDQVDFTDPHNIDQVDRMLVAQIADFKEQIQKNDSIILPDWMRWDDGVVEKYSDTAALKALENARTELAQLREEARAYNESRPAFEAAVTTHRQAAQDMHDRFDRNPGDRTARRDALQSYLAQEDQVLKQADNLPDGPRRQTLVQEVHFNRTGSLLALAEYADTPQQALQALKDAQDSMRRAGLDPDKDESYAAFGITRQLFDDARESYQAQLPPAQPPVLERDPDVVSAGAIGPSGTLSPVYNSAAAGTTAPVTAPTPAADPRERPRPTTLAV